MDFSLARPSRVVDNTLDLSGDPIVLGCILEGFAPLTPPLALFAVPLHAHIVELNVGFWRHADHLMVGQPYEEVVAVVSANDFISRGSLADHRLAVDLVDAGLQLTLLVTVNRGAKNDTGFHRLSWRQRTVERSDLCHRIAELGSLHGAKRRRP